MESSIRRVGLWLLAAVVLGGCGGPAAIVGGTPGVLMKGNIPLGDVEITVHRETGSSFEMVGKGFATSDGTFEFVLPGAQGPLRLESGVYRFTLESIGAEVVIPREYTTPATTPLRVTYDGTSRIELAIP